jgi:hypothetical protein
MDMALPAERSSPISAATAFSDRRGYRRTLTKGITASGDFSHRGANPTMICVKQEAYEAAFDAQNITPHRDWMAAGFTQSLGSSCHSNPEDRIPTDADEGQNSCIESFSQGQIRPPQLTLETVCPLKISQFARLKIPVPRPSTAFLLRNGAQHRPWPPVRATVETARLPVTRTSKRRRSLGCLVLVEN